MSDVQTDPRKLPKDAHPAVAASNAAMRAALPFEDRQDYEDASRGFIDTLPDAQRLVVNFWSAGFRYAEIAELLGKSESYVRVASHRAWQTIRKHPRVRKLLEQQPA